jgi:hypothetical protein
MADFAPQCGLLTALLANDSALGGTVNERSQVNN